MEVDATGFSYPIVNQSKCIDCGLCDTICPFTKEQILPPLQTCYAMQHKTAEILKKSTSGGVFIGISDKVLQEGGVVYGAAFDDAMVVRHMRAQTVEERDTMCGSKYVQSDIGDVFLQVKEDLKQNKPVLFTGTPCQVAGLRSFLRGKTEGLITCDLICHGVPSPLLFKEHLAFLSAKKRKKITGYYFRPKHWGWHVHREMAVFENGRQYHSTCYSDLWRNIYYSRVATRESCSNCPYSSLYRPGDLTIGDCRGIDKVLPDFGSDAGVSLVLVNTEVGRKAFEAVCDVFKIAEIDVQEVIQPPLKAPSKANASAPAFWGNFNKHGYKKALTMYFGKHFVLKYYLKKLWKMCPILQWLKG